jgi:TRAP transporter 4TM/12TM fusion protein
MTADLDHKKIQEIEERFDSELRFRPLLPVAAWIVAGALLTLSVFHYFTAGFGLLQETTHRGIHLAFVVGLIFLVFPAWKGPREAERASLLRPFGIGLHDWIMCLLAIAASLYVPWIYDDLAFRVGNPLLQDWLMGTVAILLLIEATRRSIGWPLPIIAVLLLLYGMFGTHLPSIFAHPGNSWKSIVNHLYLTSQGIYGIALGVVATYVFHYVLFGVLATRIGLGKLFIDLATAVAGRYSGGPAKVSIFASGLFGMISGSSIANTVTVGSLTIPMMIRVGYPRHFAAAVESTAATGGQITPPIMGAAAFLMVEYLNLSYQTIITAAIVPAAMHFFGVFCQVHFEARKLGMKGVPPEDLPNVGEVVRGYWPTAVPLILLLLVLFSGYTPYLAAFWGITACIVVGLTNRSGPVALLLLAGVGAAIATGQIVEWSGIIPLLALSVAACAYSVVRDADKGTARVIDITDAFVTGAKYAIGVGAAAATVGIIVGIVTLTGVGFKLANIVTGAAGDLSSLLAAILPAVIYDAKALTLFFTLVFTAFVCLLLGAGIPTTACYIIMVTIAQPALGQLGVEPIVSHFFVFYYGLLADITPPVALAASMPAMVTPWPNKITSL